MSRNRTGSGKQSGKSSKKRTEGTTPSPASAKPQDKPGTSPRSGTARPAAEGPYRTLEKPSKHPREMTSEEAVQHLFHPHVVRHATQRANTPRQDLADPGES